jgi:serine/threonine-protein kinase
MLEPGDRIDRYIVEGELGEGALATVYRVRHATLSTLHALKVVKVAHRESRERLVREGQVQAQLAHDNIVAVTDVLHVQGSPGTLMEWVQGVDLELYLMQHKLALDDALTLFRGIAAGVGHAHAKGLVHRDLKPANVLLAVGDGKVTPKVSDFGLVKALSGDAPMGSTRTGVTMGTPGYMAPEQVRDAAGVDRRADMWSLGCLLYRMVCHYPAFDQEDIIELFTAVSKGEFPAPTVYVHDLPQRVVDAIHGLLQVDPSQRFHSCEELVAFIDGVGPKPACTDGELPAVATPRSTLPTWVPEDGAVGVAAHAMMETAEASMEPQITGASPATWDNQSPRQTIAPPPDGSATERSRWPLVLAVLLALLLIGGGGAVGVLVLGLGAAYQTASDATVVEEVEPADVVTPEPAPEPEPARVEPPAPVDEPVDNDEPAEVPSDDEPVDAPTPVPRPVPAPAAPTPRPAPQPVAEQPASTGGEVRCAQCDGIASFWLSDRMGNRVDAEALTPGTYVMWVRLPEDPASHRTSEVSLTRPGEKVDVRCNAAMVTCSRL